MKIIYKIYRILDNVTSRIHNLGVADLHKTGSVKYTPFNRAIFKVERFIGTPTCKLEDWLIESDHLIL